MPRWLKPFCGSESRQKIVYVRETERDVRRDVPQRTPPPPSPPPPPERVATTIHQVCSACGVFRSPRWSARHPLKLGETPPASLCKRCANISTSSEDSGRRHRRRRYRHSRTFTNSVEHSRSSEDMGRVRRRLRHLSDSLLGDETRRSHRRYRRQSDSQAPETPRSSRRSISVEGLNIFVQSSGSDNRYRIRTISSSSESIRITRRVSYDRSPRRRRSSSFEDMFVSERFLPRRRSLSRATRGSRSSVHFEDEVEKRRVRARSDSRSYESHHSGPASESFVSQSGTRIHRRRPMQFDGVYDSRPGASAQTRLSDNRRDEATTPTPRLRQRFRSSASQPGSRKGYTDGVPVNEHPRDSPFPASSQHPSGDRRGGPCSDRSTLKENLPHAESAPRDPYPLQAEDKGRPQGEEFKEYGYEVDSQAPTPPKVTYTFLAGTKRYAPEALSVRLEHRPGLRDNRHDHLRAMHGEPSSFSPRLSPSVQHQSPRRRKFPGHEMMPDDPAHPDHLAYMMSGARITSDNNPDGHRHRDHYSDRSQWHVPSSSERAPDTPTPTTRMCHEGEKTPTRHAGQSWLSESMSKRRRR